MSGRQAGRRPGVCSRIGDLVLTLASIGGVVCILLVIAALVFDISLMLFKTGSMSPTIPAGSMAVVREIPATDVIVGDVVTVDRPGKLPVTHRVIALEPAGGELVLLTMQGDANPVPDAEPYVVDRVRIVWWSVPGVASAFLFLGRPWVMLTVAVLVAGLVTWAFWPRTGADDKLLVAEDVGAAGDPGPEVGSRS